MKNRINELSQRYASTIADAAKHGFLSRFKPDLRISKNVIREANIYKQASYNQAFAIYRDGLLDGIHEFVHLMWPNVDEDGPGVKAEGIAMDHLWVIERYKEVSKLKEEGVEVEIKKGPFLRKP